MSDPSTPVPPMLLIDCNMLHPGSRVTADVAVMRSLATAESHSASDHFFPVEFGTLGFSLTQLSDLYQRFSPRARRKVGISAADPCQVRV